MRALSIRQPYAEMILRGIKTIEYRSRPTRIIGERFLIYAAKGPATKRSADVATEGRRIWSDNLAMTGSAPGGGPPSWMMELAELLILGKLPTGVIVGSALIERVTQGPDDLFHWHLGDVQRVEHLRKPTRQPQPVWFNPF